MTNEKFFETLINAAVTAYIKVYGLNKWNSLTRAEQGEVVHTIVMDFANASLAAI